MNVVLSKIVSVLSFLFVFCLHVYFVMLVGLKPALAATSTAEVAVKTGQANSAEVAVSLVDETQAKEDVAEDDDAGISIKMGGKDGITITGSQKLVEKLKSLEEKIESRMDESTSIKNPDAVFYKFLENTLVPILIFLLSFGFAGYVIYSKNKTRRELLETIRTMAVNGQPIPQELLTNLQGQGSSDWGMKSMNSNNPNTQQGLKYLFIGLGIFGFMALLDRGSVMGALGFLFIVVGGYHMLKSHLSQKNLETQKGSTSSTDASPAGATPSSIASQDTPTSTPQ